MANVVKKSWRAAAALTGAAATVAVMSSPATAATQDINFEGHSIDFTFVQANQSLSCSQFDMAGTYNGATWAGLLEGLTASCGNPLFGSPRAVNQEDIWDFSVGSNIGGTRWSADIEGVTGEILWNGCDFDFAGSIVGVFDASDQSFRVDTSNLQVSSVPLGFLCPIYGIAQGQDIAVESGYWTNAGTPITLP